LGAGASIADKAAGKQLVWGRQVSMTTLAVATNQGTNTMKQSVAIGLDSEQNMYRQ